MPTNFEVQHLSHSYLTDAVHLALKAKVANTPSAPHLRTSYIAKLVIDAYMACECALKSMIASANHGDKGSDVYASILKCGHDLHRLVKKAQPKNINERERAFLKDASKRGVNLRYSLDLFSLTTCDLIPSDEIAFKIDQEYLKKFLSVAGSLANGADVRHKSVFKNGATPLMSQKQLKEFVAKLRAVSKRHGRKC